MNCMGMSMFVLRILGSDFTRAETRIARNAGWRWSDLIWEQLQENANEAFNTGDHSKAIELFRRASWIARLFFAKDDLRRCTSNVNLTVAKSRSSGREVNPDKILQALEKWNRNAIPAVEAMQIAPRTRNSLFHMRMEVRHRETFHGHLRTRTGLFTEEAAETFKALAAKKKPAHRHYARWNGNKPPVFDDTRKILAACLLLVDD